MKWCPKCDINNQFILRNLFGTILRCRALVLSSKEKNFIWKISNTVSELGSDGNSCSLRQKSLRQKINRIV